MDTRFEIDLTKKSDKGIGKWKGVSFVFTETKDNTEFIRKCKALKETYDVQSALKGVLEQMIAKYNID